jgi:hypothetical protein
MLCRRQAASGPGCCCRTTAQVSTLDGLLPPPINAKGHVIAGLLSGDASAPMPRDPEFRRRITGLLRQIKGGESA